MTNRQKHLWDWYHHSTHHLILTGERGIGKTTLVNWLDGAEGPFPGYRSFREDDQTFLRSRQAGEEVLIGVRVGDRMKRIPEGFAQATDLLDQLAQTDSPIVILDEVGYMERHEPTFVEAIIRLAQKKRLLLVVRRDEHALEGRLHELGNYDYFDLSESPSNSIAFSSDKS